MFPESSAPNHHGTKQQKKPNPTRAARRQPADEMLDAFKRGAGGKFLRPKALDRRTAPMLNKLWRDLRDSDAHYTLADIEAAGRQVASWRDNPVDLGWLAYGTNLVDAISRSKQAGQRKKIKDPFGGGVDRS